MNRNRAGIPRMRRDRSGERNCGWNTMVFGYEREGRIERHSFQEWVGDILSHVV